MRNDSLSGDDTIEFVARTATFSLRQTNMTYRAALSIADSNMWWGGVVH